ncbi:hypothetical protein GCM10012275_04840 [Longimycelium tulufanense]|uniref:D,D-heptose 1,7-bisphosphate phosphatase n=1 Tax=Longimycelium tulufanense TaxID=907463 RepID=A0A8J3C679_9PSEU|nr:hypothetical protein GCM10012275_04840 [Longimycelium tulufanense]
MVRDVPYNADPGQVRPMPSARAALAILRREGVCTGVLTNQSGVGRGLVSEAQLRAVNARVEELLGPFDVWAVCRHVPQEGCVCRKPAPGLVFAAATRLAVNPWDVVVIGDVGSDVAAARAAGARAVLVPTPLTRPEEVDEAPLVAPDLLTAVRWAMEGT